MRTVLFPWVWSRSGLLMAFTSTLFPTFATITNIPWLTLGFGVGLVASSYTNGYVFDRFGHEAVMLTQVRRVG